jgi:hypothetical protein
VIIDASKAIFQKEFIAALRDGGAEVILDTKVAELSERGRFRGAAKGAPWARVDEDRPLQTEDFDPRSNIDLYGSIARFAIEVGATAVLAPTHYLRNGVNDSSFELDRLAPLHLRAALDREGGDHIAIDYPLILPHVAIQDGQHRAGLIAGLVGQPFDNLVLRLSGFGTSSGPLSVKRTLLAIAELRAIGYPVVIDNISGLAGIGALAFGIASGIAHGLGERERFDARDWHKPPKERDPDAKNGRATYIPMPQFDRSFMLKDFQIVAGASGGRRLVSCHDRNCCPQGLTSMLERPRAHLAFQRFQTCQRLFDVPDTRRATLSRQRGPRCRAKGSGSLPHKYGR